MYKQYRILGIIPARGSNDEVDHLNIKELGGKPMLAYSVKNSLKSHYIDRLLVSTEDLKTAQIAREAGAEVPFLRPKELSLPDVPIAEVIRDLLSKIDEKFDIIVTLLPNAPFRTNEDIDQALRLLVEQVLDSVISVVEKKDFYWITGDTGLKPLTHKNGVVHRNECLPLYKMTGGIEAIWARNYQKRYHFGDNIGHYVMKEHNAKTINSLYDLLIAERLIKLPITLIDKLTVSE